SEAWTASRNKSAGTTVVNRLSLANDVHHYDGLTGRRNWDSKRRTPGGSAQLSQPRPEYECPGDGRTDRRDEHSASRDVLSPLHERMQGWRGHITQCLERGVQRFRDPYGGDSTNNEAPLNAHKTDNRTGQEDCRRRR